MYQLSDRCAALRDEAVNQKSYMKYYFAQRNVYYYIGAAESMIENEARSLNIASGLANVLENFSPVIIPDEIIVGFNFGEGEFSEYLELENNDQHITYMQENGISDNNIAKYFKLKELNPAGFSTEWRWPVFTEAEIQSEKEWSAIGRCISNNHTVINYELVLKKGFSGLLEDVEKAPKNT